MEYFDFEEAAQQHDIDQSSNCLEVGDLDDLDFDTSNWDGISDLDFDAAVCGDATDALELPATNTQPIDDEKEESVNGLLSNGSCPMKRAKEPCYFCRTFRLDCVVAQGGAMKNGCTCCISLYRECSFNHAVPQGKYIDTLHVVSEDAYVPTGSLTGKKVLKSYGGINSGIRRPEELEQKGRKSGARFPQRAVKILKSWLSEHSAHPYPTDDEKDILRIKTGLEKNQVSSWLANARRRGKVRPRGYSPSRGVPIPGKKLPPGVDYSELNPLERWKHSPPENEAASARDIINAMATSSFAPGSNHPRGSSSSRKAGSSNGDSQSNKRVAPSINSYSVDTTTQSSISEMSFASVYSNRSSRDSWNSADTKERRRRRHKSTIAQNSFQKHRGARIFQCTFCTDSFPTKYDWQRHEKSLHLPLDRWTCTPDGGVLHGPDGRPTCAFCQHPNPDEDHLETHNYSTCQEKPPQDRTFLRKDHLNQHLRLMHSVKYRPWMDAWKSATTEIKSRCGFCPATFTTWKDRVDHLAAHFKSGMEISQWKGGWGFDKCIENAVESGVPPYLIGHERNTLDPWVAQAPTQGGHGKRKAGSGASTASSLSMPVPADASCFQRLETELSAYVGKLLGQGIVPTDQMIQSEARMIIYGSDDAWNQTCADNYIWLSILKRDLGLSDTPDAADIRLDDLGMQPPYAADGGLRQAPKHTSGRVPSITNPPSSGSGFHSVHTSNRGSFSGSVAGSYEVFPSGGSVSGGGGREFFSSGKFPSYNQSPLSTSAPAAPTDSDPFNSIGFEADFFQRFSDTQNGISQEINDMELESAKPGDPMGLPHSSTFSSPSLISSGMHHQKFNGTPGTTSMSYPDLPILPNSSLAEPGPFEPDYSALFDPSSTAFDEHMDYSTHSNPHSRQ